MNIFQQLAGMLKPARYDTEAIALLSNKRVLAKLLKGVVPEVQKYSVQEIVGFISNEQIQKRGVHPGTKLLDRIRLLATESKIVGEGVVRFDLVMNLDIPNASNSLRIIINVEAQGNSHPGYDLITRVIYYCCRLISEQHETEFSDSNYDDIKKVYSIWICMPKKRKESSIETYSIQRKQKFGQSNPNVRYDLFEGIVIRLGKYYTKEKTFLDELSVLFSDTITVEEKMQFLQQDKELVGDEASIQKGLERMSGMGQAIFDNGVEQTKFQIMKSMVEKGFSTEQIADVFEMTEEEVKAFLKNCEDES